MENKLPYEEPEPAEPAASGPSTPSFVSYPEAPAAPTGFPPPPPPPPGFTPMPGSPGAGMRYPMPAPAPAPAGRSGGRAVPIIAIVAVLGGLLLFRMLTAVSVSVPDQIDGISRITTGPLADDANKAIEQADLATYHAVGGLYGTPDVPDFIFIAAKGTESADEDRQALSSVADGFGSDGSVGIDLDKATTEQLDGVTYNCAPMTGRGLTGAACLWNDGKTLGAVLWFMDKGTPSTFASHVHDAVVS
jgi:hypothetical protein